MATTINASTSSGLVSTADTSGVLQLQTANTTAVSISAAQVVNFTNAPTIATLTSGRVPFAGASGVLQDSANLTFSGTDLTLGNGNLVIGTSGKGIDFSATPGTGTSELLADYEEGTWTPTQGSGISGVTGTFTASGNYTKVGRLVTINFTASATSFTYTTGVGSVVGSTPFTFGAFNSYGSGVNAAGSVNLPFYGLGAVNAVYSTVSFTTSSVNGTITFFV